MTFVTEYCMSSKLCVSLDRTAIIHFLAPLQNDEYTHTLLDELSLPFHISCIAFFDMEP